ncbi:hypothetical protein MKEN_00726800 [Mycena kentingensis (nom. inval.)]|nr:hypothetical protein MKEN_00726800 [Mycena kentingensis (nom. inval.)]
MMAMSSGVAMSSSPPATKPTKREFLGKLVPHLFFQLMSKPTAKHRRKKQTASVISTRGTVHSPLHPDWTKPPNAYLYYIRLQTTMSNRWKNDPAPRYRVYPSPAGWDSWDWLGAREQKAIYDILRKESERRAHKRLKAALAAAEKRRTAERRVSGERWQAIGSGIANSSSDAI